MASKDIQLAPLTGIFDLRSTPDAIPQTGVRMRQNLQTVAEGKLKRGQGWSKFLTKTGYNNQDFHDQLLTFSSGIRQPITMIQEAESTAKVRSLFVATQSQIARLSEHGGNWKILGSGFGGQASQSASAPRFMSAKVGDYLVFTNDWDKPKYHILEQVGESGESLYEFDDLEIIGLRRAKIVWSWRNFIIFANVEMDGVRRGYSIVASDFDNPTSFDPSKVESISWSKDLMSHETILAGAPSGNAFLIYTTHGIWEMSVVGGDQTVGFRRIYNAEENEMKGVLAYPNMLVNLGDAHLYGAKDGLYFFNQFFSKPDRTDWLHRSSSLLYDNIDKANCEVHVAGIHGDEVLISVAELGQDNECPNVTLRINTEYKVCDKLDFGFTAFSNFNSQDIQTLRDFIVENEMCTIAQLTTDGYGYVSEGLPNPLPAADAAFEPMSIFTHSRLEIEGTLTVASAGTAAANTTYTWNSTTSRYEASNGYYILTTTTGSLRSWKLYNNSNVLLYTNTQTVSGTWSTTNGGSNPKPAVTLGADVVVMEDFEMTTSDSNSLCTLLGNETILEGCGGCKEETIFVAGSSEDWCLKQIGGVFHREECANPTAVGTTDSTGYHSATGSYILNGYDSIFRSAPLFVKNAGVISEHLELDYQARAQTPPSNIGLRIAISGQPADPNDEACMVWHQHSLKALKCYSDKTSEQHLKANTKPSETLQWNFWREGKVLYFELTVSGTGGDADFSRLTADVRRYEIVNH